MNKDLSNSLYHLGVAIQGTLQILLVIFLFILLISPFWIKEDDEPYYYKYDESKSSYKVDHTPLGYPFPDSKDTIVAYDEYMRLQMDMSEEQVWNIIGGQCTNLNQSETVILYGCNADGREGSLIYLGFKNGKLFDMSRHP